MSPSSAKSRRLRLRHALTHNPTSLFQHPVLFCCHLDPDTTIIKAYNFYLNLFHVVNVQRHVRLIIPDSEQWEIKIGFSFSVVEADTNTHIYLYNN
jgi:hypothetical protein